MRNQLTIALVFTFFSLFVTNKAKAHFDPHFMYLFVNMPISYQATYDNHSYLWRSHFDANVTLAFLNAGYNYNDLHKSTAYFGLGMGSIIEVQYGRNFENKYNLIRLRSDIPLYVFSSNTVDIWRFLSVGLFWDYAFEYEDRGANFGLTLSINIGGFGDLRTDMENRERDYKEHH